MEIITNQPLWQIGTGDNTRDYSKTCLDFGIAMVGPGSPGNARETPPERVAENEWGIKLTQIRVGDVVLLRRGQTLIKAVGRVIKDYDYSLSLSDIHGWDLNHYITYPRSFQYEGSREIPVPPWSLFFFIYKPERR